MRKIVVLLLLIPFIMIAAVSAKPIDVTLDNPQFTTWVSPGGYPTNWPKLELGAPAFTHETVIGHGDAFSVKYQGNAISEWVKLNQTKSGSFSVGQSATFTVYINRIPAPGPVDVTISIIWIYGTDTYSPGGQSSTQTGTWEQVTYSTTVPDMSPAVDGVQFIINFGGQGVAYADDCSVGGDAFVSEFKSNTVIIITLSISMVIIGLIYTRKKLV